MVGITTFSFSSPFLGLLLMVSAALGFPVVASPDQFPNPANDITRSLEIDSNNRTICSTPTSADIRSPEDVRYSTWLHTTLHSRMSDTDFAVTWEPVPDADGYEVCWDTHGANGAGTTDLYKTHVCALVQGGASTSFNNGERFYAHRLSYDNVINVRVAAVSGIGSGATTLCGAAKSPYTTAKELGEKAASAFPYLCKAEMPSESKEDGFLETIASVKLSKPKVADRVASGTVTWSYKKGFSADEAETFVCIVESRGVSSETHHCFTTASGKTSASYAFALKDTTAALYGQVRTVSSCVPNSQAPKSEYVAVPQRYVPFGAHLLMEPFVCLATKTSAGNGEHNSTKPQPLVYSSCKDPNVVKVKAEMDGAEPTRDYRTKDGKCVRIVPTIDDSMTYDHAGPRTGFVALDKCRARDDADETDWSAAFKHDSYDELDTQHLFAFRKTGARYSWHVLPMGIKNTKLGQDAVVYGYV